MVTARSCFLPSCCNLLQVNTNFILRGHTVVLRLCFLAYIFVYIYIEKHVGIKSKYCSIHIHTRTTDRQTQTYIHTHTHNTRARSHTRVHIFLRFAVFYVSWIDANFLTGMMRCSLSCMSRQSRICMATMLSTRIIHLGSLYCAFVDYRKRRRRRTATLRPAVSVTDRTRVHRRRYVGQIS